MRLNVARSGIPAALVSSRLQPSRIVSGGPPFGRASSPAIPVGVSNDHAGKCSIFVIDVLVSSRANAAHRRQRERHRFATAATRAFLFRGGEKRSLLHP
jgi:hypothetical protein